MENKVLILNTGGMIDKNPSLNGLPVDYFELEPLIDSSNMTPDLWKQIAKIIGDNYNFYRGFVIFHGTDTMSYTASALSFMLKNLEKPVVITNSYQNLMSAVYIAGNELFDVRLVPEVMVLFQDVLLRGNRSKKMNASDFFAFDSPNFPALGEIDNELKISRNRTLKSPKNKFYIEDNFCTDVITIDLIPGLNPEFLKNIVLSNPSLKGIILKTFGNGNTPTTNDFLDVLNFINNQGVIILNISQCPTGIVKTGLYESSSKLSKVGVISGQDMTCEAAITKLMHLLAKKLSIEETKKLLQIDMAGEQTISNYSLKIDSDNFTKQLNFSIDIPEKERDENLVKGVVRAINLHWKNSISPTALVTISNKLDIENKNLSSGQLVIKYGGHLEKGIIFPVDTSLESLLRYSNGLEITIETETEFLADCIDFMVYTADV
ncbi:MAG: asparaginase [Cetobacterium sp.]|uniref:asparaginase n=1 Tax=Cetobacterium sp. TaxID=2071632 RepID=UPI002FC91DAF